MNNSQKRTTFNFKNFTHEQTQEQKGGQLCTGGTVDWKIKYGARCDSGVHGNKKNKKINCVLKKLFTYYSLVLFLLFYFCTRILVF